MSIPVWSAPRLAASSGGFLSSVVENPEGRQNALRYAASLQ
jgi:hypothetical protein